MRGPPVEVSGVEVRSEVSSSGDGMVASYECVDETSDARVSGTAVTTVVLEHAPPTKMSRTFALSNDGGSWVGEWTGEITADRNHIMEAVLVSAGGYEGLEYEVRWEGRSMLYTIAGTIRAD